MVNLDSQDNKKFFSAVAILVGTCIGAGVLGLPYVAMKAGFFIAFLYILLLGGIVLLVNLYLSEIILRTRKFHQLIGYTNKYLGRKWRHVMEFAVVFGIYSAMIAYMVGIGQSFSFLIFGDMTHEVLLGALFGLMMTFLLKGGLNSLKKFEKMGVVIILALLFTIVIILAPGVNHLNLLEMNSNFFLLPFGVVLFALMSFHSIPEIRLVLKGREKLLKKAILSGTLLSTLFYILFAMVIVGAIGKNTPEIATLALGPIFIFLGIFTMFTSYLASGNALMDNFKFDERYNDKSSWILASLVPIILFLIIELSSFFSFTRIISIGGVVSGGLIAVLVLFMIKKAKIQGKRKPEFVINSNWIWIILLSLIFVFGVINELFLI